jgi:hypothetical protein
MRPDGDHRQGSPDRDQPDLIMHLFREAKPSKSHGGESRHGTITSPQPKPIRQGRERLANFCAQIEAAEHVIGELTEHVARLKTVVVEADAASRALQAAIAADGGVELAKYSRGEASPDDAISKLVRHERTSNDASVAAKAGLPHTETLLAAARQQLVALTNERHVEVGRVIANLASSDVAAYEASFQETCRLHDRLVGFARVSQNNAGEIHILEEPPKIARFAVHGDPNAAPFYNHQTSAHVVEQSAKRWSEIRLRLEANADADLSDLK